MPPAPDRSHARPPTLAELVRDLPVPAQVIGEARAPLTGITRDSRAVDAGSVFVAIRGANVDGHTFVPGTQAAAVVVERTDVRPPPGVATVVVPDTKLALAWLSAAWYGHPARQMKMVGVTGTNGKTTVTTLVEQAASACLGPAGRIGTTGTSIGGVPLPDAGAFTTPEAPDLQRTLAAMAGAGCPLVAMEVSSIGLAQRRVDGIPFSVAVFTNLTRDHLDFHGTMEDYRDAKARLFRELLAPPRADGPRAILYADDPAHAAMGAPDDAWTYGFQPGASHHIRAVAHGEQGTELRLASAEGTVTLSTALVGSHNALNVVATYLVLRALGVPVDGAARAVAGVSGAPGRLERVPDPGGRRVVVDYAHTDDALANVLTALREWSPGGRLLVVFGCGGDRDRGKRPRMGEVASRLADVVVITSDNPRTEDPASIAEEVLAGVAPASRVHVELDRQSAIRWALAEAQAGDVVLLAGKGHETYQEINGVRRPFDDREVARRLLEGG